MSLYVSHLMMQYAVFSNTMEAIRGEVIRGVKVLCICFLFFGHILFQVIRLHLM